jgi:hypothetical protein
MDFSFTPAVRRNTHILMALAGASGSGKTYSALELATGLAGKDGKIAVIDTEAGRALHYADKFKFDHCDMGPPFTPQRYREAIEAAEKAGYAVVVVDSFSHEHAGEGGLLEMAEAELLKPNMRSPANWAAPKAAHKRMMNRFLQCRSHLIFCLRAEEKIRIEKMLDERTQKEKTVVVQAGWQPICEKTTMFEMVVSFVMSPEHPGVPIEGSGKIQDQHRFAFPPGQLVTRKAGEALAAWAAGGVSAPAITETLSAPSDELTKLITVGDYKADEGVETLRGWLYQTLTKEQRKLLGAGQGRDYGPRIGAWIERAKQIDEQAPQDGPAEPPAASVPHADEPQAEPFLPPVGETQTDDEACTNILNQVLACRTLDEVDRIRETWKPRMDTLPIEKWTKLAADIGKHETQLFRAAQPAAAK